jgi:putative ABC transport system permease protein
MFDIERWNEIWNALSKNKLRSFLTAFGVFWGIFMLIVMTGAGNGLKHGIYDGVSKFAVNSAFMWTQRTGEPYKGFKRGRFWNMNTNDITYIEDHVQGIKYLAPKLFGWKERGGDNTVRDKRTGSFNITGDYPVYTKIDPVSMVKGRWINEIDIRNKRKVCVIGEKVAESMFDKNENPIGKYLKVSGIYFQVIGVLKPETRVNINGRKEETIFLPFTTMQQAYNYGNEVHLIAVTAKKGVSVSSMEDEIIALIKKRHSIAPTDDQALRSVNIEKQFKQMSGLFLGISILTWIVGIGTLLAGVIGVSNIMLVIVKERTREIGIQRALGATPKTIISQIVLESVFLTTLAGYIGLSLGVGLLELINNILTKMNSGGQDIFYKNPTIELPVALAALTVLILAGLFAGSIPARRALQIKPIDALRDE